MFLEFSPPLNTPQRPLTPPSSDKLGYRVTPLQGAAELFGLRCGGLSVTVLTPPSPPPQPLLVCGNGQWDKKGKKSSLSFVSRDDLFEK